MDCISSYELVTFDVQIEQDMGQIVKQYLGLDNTNHEHCGIIMYTWFTSWSVAYDSLLCTGKKEKEIPIRENTGKFWLKHREFSLLKLSIL